MNKINFTVIIPLFNKIPHIKETLDSVLSQTHHDYEVIVVDDGSTDGGGEIVAAITDPRLRLIRQENAGVSAARNKGIELSQREYIAFIDADDLWLPNHLETLDALINQFPGCGMYATSYRYINEHQQTSKSPRINKPDGWQTILDLDGYLDFVTKDFSIWTGSLCVWKAMLQKVGSFQVGADRGEDTHMWLLLAIEAPVAFINKPTALYRTDSSNRASSRWSPALSKMLEKHADLINDHRFSQQTRDKLDVYYAKRMIMYGREALIHGKRYVARKCIREAHHTKSSRTAFLKFLIIYAITFFGKNNEVS